MQIGKVPENILKRSVLRQIKTARGEVLHGAGVGEDCAIFSFGEGLQVASCVQEAGVTAEGLADLAPPDGFLTMEDLIQKCANNLAAGGAQPMAAAIALLLPECVEEPEIRALMAAAEAKCGELSMAIAGGQTRVTAAVSSPVAAVTAYGRPWGEGGCSVRAVQPGQDLVLSKWIGLQGTALLARRQEGRLRERYPSYLVEEACGFGRYLSVLPEAEIAAAQGACAMHDASEGGILGALWELAAGAGVGLTVDLRKLPLRQETVEVCECCHVNPYELLSGGCLIMAAWDGLGLKAALEAEHIPATLVGKVTGSHDRILVNGEEIRYLDRPKQDGIYAAMAAMPRETRIQEKRGLRNERRTVGDYREEQPDRSEGAGDSPGRPGGAGGQ